MRFGARYANIIASINVPREDLAMSYSRRWGFGSYLWIVVLIVYQWRAHLELLFGREGVRVSTFDGIIAIAMSVYLVALALSKNQFVLLGYFAFTAYKLYTLLTSAQYLVMFLSLIFPVLTWFILHNRVKGIYDYE